MYHKKMFVTPQEERENTSDSKIESKSESKSESERQSARALEDQRECAFERLCAFESERKCG